MIKIKINGIKKNVKKHNIKTATNFSGGIGREVGDLIIICCEIVRAIYRTEKFVNNG